MAPGLDDFAQLRVDVLDGVGRIDHLPHGGWEGQEPNHAVPGIAPCCADRGESLALRAVGKDIEFELGGLGIDGGIDGFDCGGQCLAILPARVIEAVADQVHDAGLLRGCREHRRQRFGHALEAVCDGDQDVAHILVFEVVKDLHPEFGAFNPQPQDVARAIGQYRHSQVEGLVAYDSIFAELDPQDVKENHWIHRLQRPGPLGGHFSHDCIDPAEPA